MGQKNDLQPLMILSPNLYQQLIDSLETENIHSFDIEAYGLKTKDHLEVEVRFGEEYQKVMKETFPLAILKEESEEYLNFCKNVGETCKEIMIQDYFKMVKP